MQQVITNGMNAVEDMQPAGKVVVEPSAGLSTSFSEVI
jgi:hypothetical protein